MRVHPVIEDITNVVTVVADSMGQPLSLHSELDVDVYRLHRIDAGSDGPDLVARVFGPSVERAIVDAAAHVLQRLAGTRFPAERCPSTDPVLALGDDRHVLVTEYVEPSPAPGPGFVLAWCAGLLSRLAARSGEDMPAGGGWHRLGPTPSREIDRALALGGQVGSSVAELVDTLAEADDGAGLPDGLIHGRSGGPRAPLVASGRSPGRSRETAKALVAGTGGVFRHSETHITTQLSLGPTRSATRAQRLTRGPRVLRLRTLFLTLALGLGRLESEVCDDLRAGAVRGQRIPLSLGNRRSKICLSGWTWRKPDHEAREGSVVQLP